MIIRQVDSSGDWTFGQGLNNYVRDNRAVQQLVRSRLQCWLNDCFFDTAAGLDWHSLLGGKDQTALNLAVSAVILNTQGIQQLQTLSIVRDAATRNLTVTYQAVSVYSTLVVGTEQFSV